MFYFLLSDVISLRLTRLVIPTYKFRGENAILECDFDLNAKREAEKEVEKTNYNFDDQTEEEESLYSVKWYKDNEEFYRFVPKANPPQNSYKVDGIKVDVSTVNLKVHSESFVTFVLQTLSSSHTKFHLISLLYQLMKVYQDIKYFTSSLATIT